LKILFILPEYYPHSGGGISTYYLHYIKALYPLCSEIHVIVGSGYTYSDETYIHDDVHIEFLKPEIFKANLKKFSAFDLFPEYQHNIAAAWAMWEQMNEGTDYDLIECTDFGLGYVPWLINHNKPVVTRLHGSYGQIELEQKELKDKLSGDINRLTELNLLTKSDVLITYSKSNQQYWQSIVDNDIELIYPVYELNKESLDYTTKKENFAIVCGRVQEWKGPDVLCKAVKELKDDSPEIRWYGNDTVYREGLSKSEQLLNDFPKIWKNKIVPYSAVNNSKILKLQQSAKFAIVPSTWDMFNFTCLEYMGAGVPVICSDGAGASELIENLVNGYKYSRCDSLALANCIKDLTQCTDKKYRELTNAAFETIKISLSSKNIIPKNLVIYETLLSSFEPKEYNKYFATIYSPRQTEYKVEHLLNKQPLKPLLKYVLKRMVNKFKAR